MQQGAAGVWGVSSYEIVTMGGGERCRRASPAESLRVSSNLSSTPKNGGHGVELGHSAGRWKLWRAWKMASEPLTSPHENGIFPNCGV